MRIEFQYTLEDLQEARRIGTRNGPSSTNFKRGIFGWILFIGLALLMVFLLNQQKPAPASPVVAPASSVPPKDLFTTLLIPMIPWLLLVLFLWVVIFRYRRGYGLKKSPLLMKPISMEIDEHGIFSSDGPTHTRWEWGAFDKTVESPDRFFLRLNGSTNFIIIPKRALNGPVAMEQVQALLGRISQGPTGAFPVIPLNIPEQRDAGS
jgi:hypothetical protein